MRNIDTIFIHCSATQADWMANATSEAKRDEIDRWHRERGFRKIGYHYIIDRDGAVLSGRSPSEVGAHVKGHNAHSLGICLLGGFGSNENDYFADHFTAEQDHALRELINRLKTQYPSITKVRGHNEVAAKACPGFNVPRWLDNKPERKVTQSTTVRASAVQMGTAATGAVAAVGGLHGTAQLVAIVASTVVLLAAMWILRERLRQWARGVH